MIYGAMCSVSATQALRALSRVVLWTVANPSRTLDDVESITKWLLSPGAVHLLLRASV